MGRDSPLTERERGKIEGLGQAGVSIKEIARKVKRSTDAVRCVLNVVNKQPRKMMGPAPIMTERDVRRLVWVASTGDFTAPQLRSMLNLTPSVSTIQRVLANWLCYTKLNSTLPLSKADKISRMAWAWKMPTHSEGNSVWEKIIFYDEKNGTLTTQTICRITDGIYAEHHENVSAVRLEEGPVCAQGKTRIAFLTGRQNSEDYIYIVSEILLPYAHLHYGTEFIYQPDGASIHTSKASLEFPKSKGFRSSDHNPIDNLWSILTRRVYQNGCQFNSVAELRVAIEAACEGIDSKILRSLIDSMPRRCQEVIEKNGNKTHY
ncbi:transposable element tc3 Transposase [Phytophthora palmivora]|uniref:Transposable element tc3 Transposase n=1 Tax=Phytophthora palmivora TaxID=4796 RepID=A0A2P4Y9E6_9STRA|nr:transposable element tc3 Transposase [Phytophthora palmivora]